MHGPVLLLWSSASSAIEIAAALEAAGHEVFLAHGGAAAIEAVQDVSGFAAVLIDVGLEPHGSVDRVLGHLEGPDGMPRRPVIFTDGTTIQRHRGTVAIVGSPLTGAGDLLAVLRCLDQLR